MKRAAAVLLLAMVGASCADPPAVPAGEPGEPASITVAATYDESSCCYVEGFIGFVAVTGPGLDVEKKLERFGGGVVEVAFEVPRGGEYTLESWVEPCAGNCGNTDPPTDHCSASISVRDGEDLEIDLTIRTAHPCELSVEGS